MNRFELAHRLNCEHPESGRVAIPMELATVCQLLGGEITESDCDQIDTEIARLLQEINGRSNATACPLCGGSGALEVEVSRKDLDTSSPE